MIDRTRCCCVLSDRWHDRRDINNYIRSRVARAIEIKKNTDPADKIKLSRGLTCMLDLKDMGYDEVGVARAIMKEEIPFRLEGCYAPLSCCGYCTRSCDFRCVQDVMNKLYMKAINIYMGNIDYEDADLVSQLAYRELMNPQTTYETLNSIVAYAYSNKGGVDYDKKKKDQNSDAFRYNYAPVVVTRVDDKGKVRPEYNPETGEIHIINWPDTGLCPYCLPRKTHVRIRANKGDGELGAFIKSGSLNRRKK